MNLSEVFMKEINDLQIGKVGEYLVCADIILQGFVAFPSEQGLHYDVVIDVNGKMLRVQVKTTRTYRRVPQREKRTDAYLFNCRRCGKGGRHSYKDEDIDIMAFVAVEDKLIGYLPISKVRQTMIFRTKKLEYPGNKSGTYIEDLTLEKCLN